MTRGQNMKVLVRQKVAHLDLNPSYKVSKTCYANVLGHPIYISYENNVIVVYHS